MEVHKNSETIERIPIHPAIEEIIAQQRLILESNQKILSILMNPPLILKHDVSQINMDSTGGLTCPV